MCASSRCLRWIALFSLRVVDSRYWSGAQTVVHIEETEVLTVVGKKANALELDDEDIMSSYAGAMDASKVRSVTPSLYMITLLTALMVTPPTPCGRDDSANFAKLLCVHILRTR